MTNIKIYKVHMLLLIVLFLLYLLLFTSGYSEALLGIDYLLLYLASPFSDIVVSFIEIVNNITTSNLVPSMVFFICACFFNYLNWFLLPVRVLTVVKSLTKKAKPSISLPVLVYSSIAIVLSFLKKEIDNNDTLYINIHNYSSFIVATMSVIYIFLYIYVMYFKKKTKKS